MEQIHPKFREEVAMFTETIASGIGIAFVSVNGFFMNNWVQNQVFMAVSIAIFIPVFYKMPESYRWLFSKGRISEGKESLRKFCLSAGFEYREEEVDEILLREAAHRKNAPAGISSKSILRYPKMRRLYFCLIFIWSIQSMIYYGILLGSLPGGVLINNAVLGKWYKLSIFSKSSRLK